jgi:hypothetical protein
MTDEDDQRLFRRKFRLALASTVFGVLMVVASGLIEAFTDLNGMSGIGLGIFYALAGFGYAVWAHRKGRTRAPR